MGARKAYVDSLEFYHEKVDDLYYHFPLEQRSFPVPEPMLPNRVPKQNNNRHFDIVIVADFRTIDGQYPSFTKEIDQIKNGRNIGLVQMSKYSLSIQTEISSPVRNIIMGIRFRCLFTVRTYQR